MGSQLEYWNGGIVGRWKDGKMEGWKVGMVGRRGKDKAGTEARPVDSTG